MILNHINLQVADVNAAREFFERFFGLRCRYQRQTQIAIFEEKTGMEFAVSNLFDSLPPAYPPDFHVGFVLEHTADVHDVYNRLKDAGIAMKLRSRRARAGAGFSVLGPDNIPIEVRAPKDG